MNKIEKVDKGTWYHFRRRVIIIRKYWVHKLLAMIGLTTTKRAEDLLVDIAEYTAVAICTQHKIPLEQNKYTPFIRSIFKQVLALNSDRVNIQYADSKHAKITGVWYEK